MAIHTIEVRDRRLSCSFGVAKLSPEEDFDGLFSRADIALYRAKKAGGDTIQFE